MRLSGWLDLMLAWRMLARYPGLTIVGGLALAVGIPISLAPVQLALALHAPLPFDEADRIVGLEYLQAPDWHDRRPDITDFERWRRELTSFEPLAAARRRSANVIGNDGRVEVVFGSEITATGFAVTRVAPRAGRTFADDDERIGADPVVLISDDLWKMFFAAAPDAIGRTLQVGRTRRTVIGVMPPGFLFPYREHFWIPFESRAIDYEFGKGPGVWVFGRLRDGVSRDAAQAEFTAVGQRIAADHPETHGQLRAHITKHLAGVVTGLSLEGYPAYFLSLLLLAAMCANVGTLMLARTATRSTELAIRSALGARRSRIVMQLFVEALVLSTLAGAVGLGFAELATRPLQTFEAAMPFWFDLGVKPSTVAAVAGLVLFSAVIAGLLPALKATRTRVYPTLQRQQSASLRFGATATLLIVVEVAVAVGGLSGVATVARSALRDRSLGEGVAADEYVTTELRLIPRDAEPLVNGASQAGIATRLAEIQGEIGRRLSAEPGVRAFSFASVLPGMQHERAQVEVEGERAVDASAVHTINRAFVAADFFKTLGQQVSPGRDFEARDLVPRGRPIIVNRSFAETVLTSEKLGRRPAVGQRIRYLRPRDQPAAPWLEIIGVVNDLGMNVVEPQKSAGIYHVITPGQALAPQLLVRVGGDAEAFVPRLRTILTSVEADLVLSNPVRLDRVFSQLLWQAQFSSIAFTLVAAIAVVLSAAGLYALMALSVSQRTSEIAIRAALGARPFAIMRLVTVRAMLQLAAGVLAGAGLAFLIIPEVLDNLRMTGDWRQMMAAVAVAMVAIGLLACVVPTRRALRIQPSLALKE